MGPRREIRTAFQSNSLDAASSLLAVPGLGPYLSQRLATATHSDGTIGGFWRGTRRLSTERVRILLLRALQNKRGNQCVTSVGRSVGLRGDDTAYHTGDINQWGYEAAVALLDEARTRAAPVRYGRLKTSLPVRERASRVCGCRLNCESDRNCTLARNGSCVPRSSRVRGFDGASPRPGQKASTRHASRVRRASRARRLDASGTHDLTRGHARTARYATHNDVMWRMPGPLVRLPLPT